jgi:putative isomerase
MKRTALSDGCTFNPRVVPASVPDSWLSLSREIDYTPPGFYLRTCHSVRDGSTFGIELLDAKGGPVNAQPSSTPALTVIQGDGARLECVFGAGGALRLRVRDGKARLALQHIKGGSPVIFALNSDRIQVSLTWVKSQFAVTRLAGRMTLDAPWQGERVERGVIELVPRKGEWAELAVEAMQSTWPATSHSELFDDVVARRGAEFAAFLKPLPAALPGHEATRALAGYILWSCLAPPRGLVTRPVMLMSKHGMNRVWSWDHCFNALALAGGHPDLAWDQFQAFADKQDANGCFPDSYNPMGYGWEFVKPPVHGWTLARMIEWADPGTARLREAYDPLVRWTRWWLNARDSDGDGLPEIHHGNDTGADNSTIMNLGMPLATPDIAAYLVLQLDALAHVAQRLGRRADATLWREESARLLKRHLALQWRAGEPRAIRPGQGALPQPGDALQPWMTVVLGDRLPATRQRACVKAISRFRCVAGLATETLQSTLHERDGYWRGPVWAPYTLLACDGLRRMGQSKLASQIAADFVGNCRVAGFAENFAADNGAPLRDRAYSWTASAYLVLTQNLRERNDRKKL